MLLSCCAVSVTRLLPLLHSPADDVCLCVCSLDEVHGGSPWGAGTFAGGDGSRQPSATELLIAEHQASPAAPFLLDCSAGCQKMLASKT